ncbi:MAG: hypothetical protein IJI36_15630 [Kiritimatiellae bacterium]|nr:hypothetical protein [Kiritimatiellia bacterium]
MKKLTTIVLAAALSSALFAEQYSKLGIITAAKSAGKWDALKSWIATAGYTDEWQAAAFFSDQYPAFAQITNAVVASGVATAQEVEAILAAARDTAPDALLAAVYAHDMQSSSGRARWHGGNPVSEYRTNETTRIIERADIYPDGWEYIDPASRRKALTPEEAAARAASRRTAKQVRINSLQAQLDALREQLTVPATNDELIVSQAQARIRIASIQRTLDRLTAPTSTNVVVITVTPPTP